MGDTDFSQTAHLDGWDDQPEVTFLFGIDATANLQLRAELLHQSAWQKLSRPRLVPARSTGPRARPKNVKQKIVEQRCFKDLRLRAEHVAEIEYRPGKCKRSYRLIVCRKSIDVEMGRETLWREYRYFFFITNDRTTPAGQLVLEANGRCDQENLIEQLKNGVHAMKLPVDSLLSNWAYMVMASLAWTLKAWFALLLPKAKGPGRERRERQKRLLVRMEFKSFAANLIRLPCQIVRSGRRLIYRLLSYNPWQEPLLAGVAAWRTRTQC